MTDSALQGELAELLREAGRVHHQAFIEVDGEDADWPLWYASYLLERFRLRVDPTLTRSKLAAALVLASEDYACQAPDTEWAIHVARFLLVRRGT